MKFSIRDLLLVTVFVALGMSNAAFGDDPGSQSGGERYSSGLFEKNWWSTIPDDALRRSPKWDANSENPPVSAKKAMKLSREVAERIAKADKGLEGWKCQLDGATLQKSADKEHWFWKVQYIWHRDGIGTGTPPYAQIIVLMDGTVVEPKPEGTGVVK